MILFWFSNKKKEKNRITKWFEQLAIVFFIIILSVFDWFVQNYEMCMWFLLLDTEGKSQII